MLVNRVVYSTLLAQLQSLSIPLFEIPYPELKRIVIVG